MCQGNSIGRYRILMAQQHFLKICLGQVQLAILHLLVV